MINPSCRLGYGFGIDAELQAYGEKINAREK